MYRNLCPTSLGITGRQSELIELALTYGFEGIDLDIQHFTKQVELRGLDHAARFLKSAELKIGPFDLPVRWDGEEDVFKEDLDQVRELLSPASEMGSKTCYTTVQPASDTLPYHENFEFHRDRLTKLAELLATYEMRLGLTFLAVPAHREGRPYQFISSPDALLTLIKTIVAPRLRSSVRMRFASSVGRSDARSLPSCSASSTSGSLRWISGTEETYSTRLSIRAAACVFGQVSFDSRASARTAAVRSTLSRTNDASVVNVSPSYPCMVATAAIAARRSAPAESQ